MRIPLSDIEEITPQFLSAFGVTEEEIQRGVLAGYGYWIGVLSQVDPEAALKVIKEFLQFANSQCVGRDALADAWLRAGGLHFKQGRAVRALAAVGHAILAHPVGAGRSVKRALAHVTAVLRWTGMTCVSTCS